MIGIRLSDDWNDPGWSMVPRVVLRDERLSFKAMGLVAYLASHEAGFRITRSFLNKASKDGEDGISSGIAELRNLGYLTVERGRDELGRVTSESSYVLHKNPQVVAQNGISPVQENPEPGKSGTKRDNSKETQQDQKDASADATAPKDSNEAKTAAAVVAAFVDAYRLDKGGDPVTIRKVAGHAKKMLADGADFDLLLLAATEMGKTPWSDLGNQYARTQAASKVAAPTKSEDSAKAWIRENWDSGRVKPIEDRTGLSFPMPDIPASVTREQMPDFLKSARRAWITANKDTILTRLLGKVSA